MSSDRRIVGRNVSVRVSERSVGGTVPSTAMRQADAINAATRASNVSRSVSLLLSVKPTAARRSAIVNSVKGDVSGSAVLDVVRRMNNSMKVLPLSRVTFADTVRTINQGESFTLSGASGAIRFTPEGSRDPSLFERWTIDLSKPGQPDYLSTAL